IKRKAMMNKLAQYIPQDEAAYFDMCSEMNHKKMLPYEVFQRIVENAIEDSSYMEHINEITTRMEPKFERAVISTLLNSSLFNSVARYDADTLIEDGVTGHAETQSLAESFHQGVVSFEDSALEQEWRKRIQEEGITEEQLVSLFEELDYTFYEADNFIWNEAELLKQMSENYYIFDNGSGESYVTKGESDFSWELRFTQRSVVTSFNTYFPETKDVNGTVKACLKLLEKKALYEEFNSKISPKENSFKSPMDLRDEQNITNSAAKTKSTKLKI
ncbi:MAG TPA: hypothetical protein VM577_03505, partial [Anaerovoracaceae bacterium]|nr:hypothetical protein [Anaerovoracaceae bacterium]